MSRVGLLAAGLLAAGALVAAAPAASAEVDGNLDSVDCGQTLHALESVDGNL